MELISGYVLPCLYAFLACIGFCFLFNIHGIGFLTYQSILKGEANLVVSIVTLLMLIFVVCNLVVDMLYAALDPRIRYA